MILKWMCRIWMSSSFIWCMCVCINIYIVTQLYVSLNFKIWKERSEKKKKKNILDNQTTRQVLNVILCVCLCAHQNVFNSCLFVCFFFHRNFFLFPIRLSKSYVIQNQYDASIAWKLIIKLCFFCRSFFEAHSFSFLLPHWLTEWFKSCYTHDNDIFYEWIFSVTLSTDGGIPLSLCEL